MAEYKRPAIVKRQLAAACITNGGIQKAGYSKVDRIERVADIAESRIMY